MTKYRMKHNGQVIKEFVSEAKSGDQALAEVKDLPSGKVTLEAQQGDQWVKVLCRLVKTEGWG